MRAHLVAAAAAAALLAALGASAQPASLKVVASHLNNPRKLFVAPDGALYVVEAGTGGRDKCLVAGGTPTCIGMTGSIAKIVDGAPKRIVTHLWSGARKNGQQAQGPADVLVRGNS